MKTQSYLWDAAKTDLRGKFIAIQTFLKKNEENLNKSLTYHLKELEKRKKEKKTQETAEKQ